MCNWAITIPNMAWLTSTPSWRGGGPNPYIDKASCSRETDLEETMFRAILAEQAVTKTATD